MEPLYAVCIECGHIEPRPMQATECWEPCERCGECSPHCIPDSEEAERISEEILTGN